MTSNDVRDILSLPDRNAAKASSSRQRKSAQNSNPHPSTLAASKSKVKYDGITRELFALLGDNAPTLAMAQGMDGKAATSGAGAFFKPKFQQRRKEKVKQWRWQPFRNPARADTSADSESGLVLHHWAPVTDDDNNDSATYRFADFNTSSGTYVYSNDEYIQHLRDDDWTKEETDYLVEMCATYDLRFVVLHDRYQWTPPSGVQAKERSIEDLKARYYAICRRLIRSRISTEDVESRQLLLSTYAFDKQREVERKRALAHLYTRTPEQLAEEEALYVEIRRIEQNEAKYASEREELLRLLGGWESLPSSSPHAVAAAGSGIAGIMAQDDDGKVRSAASNGKKRKVQQTDDQGTPGAEDAPSAPRPSATLTSKQRAELRQAQFDELQGITRFPASAGADVRPPYAHLVGTASTLPPTTPNATSLSSGHGVYLRSTRMLTPRPNLFAKTAQTLAELTPPIGPRLVFPTARNVERWENLVGAVTTSLEMKKQLDRVHSELRIAQQRLLAAQTNQPPPTEPVQSTTEEVGDSTIKDESVA